MSYITELILVSDDPNILNIVDYIESFKWSIDDRPDMGRRGYLGKPLDTTRAGGSRAYISAPDTYTVVILNTEGEVLNVLTFPTGPDEKRKITCGYYGTCSGVGDYCKYGSDEG